jgi:hypothetical protein
MLERALLIRRGLQQCLFSDAFTELEKHSLPALRTKASAVKNIILNDQLWKHAKSIVVVGQPICELLDFTNAEVCC